jgi:DNA-binding NarL/FixJ family response regulator
LKASLVAEVRARMSDDSVPSAAGPGGLVRRELQIASLVARGLKDRDIAERLHISPRTAGKHVEHIRSKLDLRTRSELGAWTTRLGLLASESI